MDINEVFELMKNNTKVVFKDSWDEKILSSITGIDKDSKGSYRIYDNEDDYYSLDSIEKVEQEKFKDVIVIIKNIYDTDSFKLKDSILRAFEEDDIYCEGLTVKE